MIIYEGPSLLNGAPIYCVATFNSSNSKTGPMAQTWIMPQQVERPSHQTSEAVCGNCNHRKGSCYVNLAFAPSNIHRKYLAGGYRATEIERVALLFKDKGIRLGSYGDPAALPYDLLARITNEALFHTGYTHQWRNFPALKELCMASVDSEAEYREAKSLGWRTFRTNHNAQVLGRQEIICPASDEKGKLTTCDKCQACGGLSSKARCDITIKAHGSPAKLKVYNEYF